MSQSLWNWARIIYSIPLLITGAIYLWKPQESVESLVSFIPGGLNLIYAAGFFWVIIGFMIAFDVKTRVAAWGAIILLSLYQIMVHIPALYTGDYLAVVWFELLRDLSLMGGALFILAWQGEFELDDENDEWNVSVH